MGTFVFSSDAIVPLITRASHDMSSSQEEGVENSMNYAEYAKRQKGMHLLYGTVRYAKVLEI